MNEKIKQILEKHCLVKYDVDHKGQFKTNRAGIMFAIEEIKKLFHDIVPKEKGLCSGKDFDKLSDCEYALKTERNLGHDKAIKEMHEKINKL